MKKQLFFGLVLAAFYMLPSSLFAQSTEGTDFWVTFLQADKDNNNPRYLMLCMSAREDCQVTVENPHTNYKKTLEVKAGQMTTDTLYASSSDPKNRQYNDTVICYSYNSEVIDTSAVHVTVADGKKISLFAANYKTATFDATNVLPTSSLMDKYVIQTATPCDHEGDVKSQGSHFGIIATEDNTVVEYTLTAATSKHNAGETVRTDTLKQGEVWYVWTGMGAGHDKDLSGTEVKALNGKKIAVFQGNPHTNLPYYGDFGLEYGDIRERDHVVSQAMPIQYWGKTFAITASKSRKLDVVRVMAMLDSTVVRINGDSVYTFDFATNPKHYFEFQIGEDGVVGGENKKEKTRPTPLAVGTSCFLETTCPCATHLFITSRGWDGPRKDNHGDPAMIWINPIEQQIDQITFTTFDSKNTSKQDPAHYVNIVTTADNADNITLDGVNQSAEFEYVAGSNNQYKFARLYLGDTEKSYTLKGDPEKGFIAHVYGYTANESYGYSAGGRTNDLTAFIIINGNIYRADADNKPICGDDTIHFGAELNYEFDSIYWAFGDGKDTITFPGTDSLPHFYELAGVYNGAYALIYRHMGDDDGCINFSAYDSIHFVVNVGSYKVDITKTNMPECTQKGDEVDFLIYLDNPAGVDLTSDSVQFTFNQAAIDDGFTDDAISFEGDTLLKVHLPKDANDGVDYGMHLHIGSECPNSVLDKDLTFSLKFTKSVLVQRYNNVLGLAKDSFPNQTLSDFVWFHDGDTVKGQETSVLYLDEQNPDNVGEYKVCYTIHEAGKPDLEDCTCPVRFEAGGDVRTFDENSLTISATYSPRGKKVFVNADWNGKTDIECYAEWIDVSGRAVEGMRFELPDGGCTIDVPADGGFYILRVNTDGGNRSFKMFINY